MNLAAAPVLRDAPGLPPQVDHDAEPAVRGGALLLVLDRALGRVDTAVADLLPRSLNPFLQLGALANWCFAVASVTGVLLLFWYVPSVHEAHASMTAMDQAPWTSGLVRSLHRYSSDACMVLVLVHALKVFCARRFTGPRWLAWITGAVSLLGLWLVGWLGYWLVWDQPAQHVAEGTSRALDVIPLFVDPLERSFVADQEVNSLLFFLVFFAHMLLPLGVVVGLWLHITRLARAHFLPGRAMATWSTLVLVLVSVLQPAQTGAPARMAVMAREFAIDGWYLAPLWLTDRLAGGALWLFWFAAGSLLCAVPWLLRRGRVRAAAVQTERCNACTKCSQDCPYLAITMVPRTDGKPFTTQAQVDPRLCVGCGICAGSCDTSGVGLPWLPEKETRDRLAQRVADAAARGRHPGVLLACVHGAAAAAPPDWIVEPVPCAGFVHMLTPERLLKDGAREIVIAACADGACRYREGDRWARQRRDGERAPALRGDRVDADAVRVLTLPPGTDVAAALTGGPARRRPLRLLAGALAVLLLIALVPLGSALPYRTPHGDPELVVSFKHPGQLTEQRRELSAEEQARLPVHMRRQFDLVRTRQPVRLQVLLDDRVVLTRTLPPAGLWGDGNSVALERLAVPPGRHRVAVRIDDDGDAAAWAHSDSAEVDFAAGLRRTVLFDRHHGFTWL